MLWNQFIKVFRPWSEVEETANYDAVIEFHFFPSD